MGNRTNYGTGRMTVDNRQKNERSRSGNPYSSHVKAGKHAGTVYNFKRKSRIRKSLTRLPILLEFIHKYIFLNFVSFYNGLNSNYLMAGVHEMKTYKCVHEASCIAIAKEIKNKIHKTHKTTVKQRKNKMKTSQNAHNRMKNRKFNS